jgi:hypothetical protein
MHVHVYSGVVLLTLAMWAIAGTRKSSQFRIHTSKKPKGSRSFSFAFTCCPL